MDKLVCCKCESSSEIFDSGSDVLGSEEGGESIDLVAMKKDLLAMQEKIEKHQQKLRYFTTCPSEDCVNYDIELNLSRNADIAKLQRSGYMLRCQTKEIVDCCKVAREELVRLRSLVCERADEVHKLQRRGAAIESWRRTLEHEAGLCIERFEYLKLAKAEWADVMKLVEKDRKNNAEKEKGFVPKTCFVKDKKYFLQQIAKLKRMFKDLFELQHMPYVYPTGFETELSDFELRDAEKEYIELKNKANGNESDSEKNSCE